MKTAKISRKFFNRYVSISILFVITMAIVIYELPDRYSPSMPDVHQKYQKTAPGPDPYPAEWAWIRRTFPHWTADAQAFREEMTKAQRMRTEAPDLHLKQVDVQFAGPTNIAGRISDIEFNPLNPTIVYASAANGGVFKSTDTGTTWFPIFDGQANLNVGDIGIDPVNPDIIYVGTGEANGGHNNFPGGGVYKSTDAGATWQLLGLENTASIGRIIVDPSNTQRVFLAAVGSYFLPNPERGVYLSTNGGTTWSQSLFVSDSTGAIDIVMDPNNPQRLLATMWERVRRPNSSHLFGPTSGMYRSTDGGGSWQLLGPNTGLPDATATNVGRIGLTIYPPNPDIVYALYNDGSNISGFFKTTNFGGTWVDADPNNGLSSSGFSWYFGQTRVKPDDSNTLYVMDVTFKRSTNGGTNWSTISSPGFHVDHHALAFHPDNPNFIIEGNDGGIDISSNAGASFSPVAQLPITQFYEIGLDRTNPQRLYGGTQDNSTVRTLTGALNDWDVLFGGDGFYTIVDPFNPNIIYAESQFGNLGKSTNGGASFFSILSGINGSEPTNWSTPVIMDPNDNNTLYYGTNRVYRTTNAGSFWTAISPDLTTDPGPRLGTVTTIGVAPSNSDVIWVGTDESNVWVTTNGGTNWTNVSATLPFRWVTRVIPDPLDENTAYVTFSGLKWVDPQPHVFRTTNQGQSWEDISNNLPDAPINAFAVDPLNTDNLFVGSDLGAYFSTDFGQSWQYISNDFPMVSVYDMKIHETANYLAIGTHARSMYTLDLANLQSQFSMGVDGGWNMIGRPLDVSDSSVTTLFPTHMPNSLFSFNGSYQSETHVAGCTGYWLNFTEAASVPITGNTRSSCTINLNAGWNMIAGPSCNVDVTAIDDPNNIITGTIFGFDGAYFTATTIEQGRGYWVNASEPGTISLSCTAPAEKRSLPQLSDQIDLNRASNIQISEGASGYQASQTLYFNVPLDDRNMLEQFRLPPVPPANIFDARFTGDYFLSEDKEALIRLQASRFPVTIRAANIPDLENSNYIIEEMIGGNSIKQHVLRNGQTVKIVNPNIKTLRLVKSEGIVPIEFSLHQNYPNPFNPNTTIQYEIPEKSQVEVLIFNELGQKVRTLFSQVQEAGIYETIWDGTNDARESVSSGIYFYRITAQSNSRASEKFSAIRKMVLLK